MSSSTPAGVEWRLVPRFLIRGTGFAFELLDRLRMPASERSGLALSMLQARIEEHCACFEQELFPRALQAEQSRQASSDVFREWYALNQLVRKRRACSDERAAALSARWSAIEPWIATWNGLLGALEAARADLERNVACELRVARERLRATVTDARMQEALLLSNPEIYSVALPSYLKHFQADARPAKVRYLERQLFAYVQRLCAKNDTTSFFGPIDYGAFELDSKMPFAFAQGSLEQAPARLTRLSYWAVQALADTLALEPEVRPYLRPRLADGCAVDDASTLLVGTTNQRVALPARVHQLLARIDAGVSHEHGATQSELSALHQRGLITLGLQIPTSVFDPLAWLESEVQRLPAECAPRALWQRHLAGLRALLERFPTAASDAKLGLLGEIEDQFQTLTDLPARRGHGATYADRLVLYDEAQGDIARCTVGAPLADTLVERLAPTLDLCASYSAVVQAVCRARARQLLIDSAGGAPLPYLAFARQVEARLSLESCLADPSVVEFLDRLAAIARSRVRAGQVQLSAADLAPLLRPVAPGSLISPDIFLAAPDAESIGAGEFDLIIGEIHYGAQVWCHFLTFDTDRARLEQSFVELLGDTDPSGGRVRANLVHRRLQGKTFPLELPGMSVEVGGRSTRPRHDVLSVADLEVVASGAAGLEVRSRSRGLCLELYPGDPRAVSNWLFGTPPMLVPPVHWGIHTPRVRVGDATLWRARWELPASALVPPGAHPSPSDTIAHACALRQRHGLPRRVFARVPSERKPLFVDFANLFSLELLQATVRDNTSVAFTEVLPGVDQWWLRRNGRAHSCEWRTTLVAHSPGRQP